MRTPAFIAASLCFTRLTACASAEPAPEHRTGHHHGPEHRAGHDHGHDGGMPHRFDDPEKWAAVFDSPERDAWQQPDLVVARLATRKDMKIADIGAGTGYFSVRFARAVPDGEVLAIDIEAALLQHLAARAAGEGLGNVHTRHATPAEPGLADRPGAIDLVFVCDTYHHIADRPAYFTKVAQALAPGGRIAIVDFELDSPRGPPPELKLAPDAVITEMNAAGLVLVGRFDELPDQYLLEFARP